MSYRIWEYFPIGSLVWLSRRLFGQCSKYHPFGICTKLHFEFGLILHKIVSVWAFKSGNITDRLFLVSLCTITLFTLVECVPVEQAQVILHVAVVIHAILWSVREVSSCVRLPQNNNSYRYKFNTYLVRQRLYLCFVGRAKKILSRPPGFSVLDQNNFNFVSSIPKIRSKNASGIFWCNLITCNRFKMFFC